MITCDLEVNSQIGLARFVHLIRFDRFYIFLLFHSVCVQLKRSHDFPLKTLIQITEFDAIIINMNE